MATPTTPAIPSREEQARREIGVTAISPRLAVAATAAFLLLIIAVPVAQIWLGPTTAVGHWRGTGAALAQAWRGADGPGAGILAANRVVLERIQAFERALDDECRPGQALRPPMQALLCRAGVGNEKALVGRDGWLFYEPAVRSLTGPGFLDPRHHAAVRRGENETTGALHPDPRPAILAFRDDLAARGIALVLLPVPAKASIHPEHLTTRCAATEAPVRNRSWAEFTTWAQAEGLAVFDSAPLLVAAARDGAAYLATDTHWRPEAMRRVAAGLADHLVGRGLIGRGPSAWCPGRASVSNHGDIAVMLRLPDGQNLYPQQTVELEQVLTADGAPWTAQTGAPVLLLGDSFTNIYSTPDLGWGVGGGLAEHLALALRQPLDRISRNDAGAHATRALLAEDLARGRDRLAGVKVVVWEFAERELALGDWRPIPLPTAGAARPPTGDGSVPAAGVTGEGLVAMVSERPDPAAAYKDFVMKALLRDLTGPDGRPLAGGEAEVSFLAKRDGVILPAAAQTTGVRVRWRLVPYETVESRFGTLKTGELLDLDFNPDRPRLWAEPGP